MGHSILHLCQKCGNRLQPWRGNIVYKKSRASGSRGHCDVCRARAEVSEAGLFGLVCVRRTRRATNLEKSR